MKITLFTSNQPRHLALASTLAEIAESVFVVQECNTVFPGQVDDFFKKSPVMQDYFSRVMAAEHAVFGGPVFMPENVRTLSIKMGDLNGLSLEALQPALDSDFYVVFGSSYIKGDLCDFLVNKGALNIHMGMSPWYRGSSCNFWALYDRRPELVGATIHRLSTGLDSGDMLFHALPLAGACEGFLLGMQAVKAAHLGLSHYLGSGEIASLPSVAQQKSQQIRYTRNRDFNDEVAQAYLDGAINAQEIGAALAQRELQTFVRPYVLE